MSRAIFEKALSELTWADLETVIKNSLEEDQTLEFKETLPAKDGNPDLWQSKRGKIGDHARDVLAAEIVAFANAYGGVLIIGIGETDDKPPRAKAFATTLIKDCVECVERLGPALRSRFDPPIAGFDIRAVPKPDGDGEGLVVIRVASSTLAPHGVGRPPEAYVRRGSAKEPLTMRDLHNLFWESRTRQERVIQARNDRQVFMMDLEYRMKTGCLHSSEGNIVPAKQYLMFRCTIVPEQSLGLNGIAAELLRTPLLRPAIKLNGGGWAEAAFGHGGLPHGWRPKAHAAQAEDSSSRHFSLWTIRDDGLVEVVGFSFDPYVNNKYCPEWYSITVAQVLLMAEKLRLRAGRPDVPLVVDARFRHNGSARACLDGQDRYRFGYEDPAAPDENILFGPFVAARRAELPTLHREVEREIWFGLGVPGVLPLGLDFEAAFSSYLGILGG